MQQINSGKKPISISKSDNTYDLHLMWDLHHKCNYHCSYCHPGLNNGSVDYLNLDLMKGFIDSIEDHYIKKLNYKNVLFSFAGGEPTLWKDFQTLLDYTHNKGIRFGLTTNGSVNTNFWKRTSSYFDYICLSFHAEYADVDKFLTAFEYLHNDKNCVIPSVRLMMHKKQEYWDKCIKVLEQIKKFPNWTYECVYILDNYSTMHVGKSSYPSREQEDFLEKNAFHSQFLDDQYIKLPSVPFDYTVEFNDCSKEKLDENVLINRNQIDYFGWECNIGLESLFVDASGGVYRSGCAPGRMFGMLGTVDQFQNIKYPTTPVYCNTTEGCYCPTDIRIGKRKLF